MDAFDDSTGLRVPSCCRFPFQAIVILTHLGKLFFPFRGIVYGPMRSTDRVSQGFVSACLGGIFHISDLLFLLFFMLGTSYTRHGLLCEGLSSQSVEGGCALFESPLDDRASHDTNLQFSSVVPQVSIFCYFGILDDGLFRPNERCRGYSLYVRLYFL